jgi:hypothetical protein
VALVVVELVDLVMSTEQNIFLVALHLLLHLLPKETVEARDIMAQITAET